MHFTAGESMAEIDDVVRTAMHTNDVTLEPAALVNESFMRLIRQRLRFDNRSHFFAIVTHVMLRVLSDYRRRRGARITSPVGRKRRR